MYMMMIPINPYQLLSIIETYYVEFLSIIIVIDEQIGIEWNEYDLNMTLLDHW